MIPPTLKQRRTEVNARYRMQLRDCNVGLRVIHETLGPGEVIELKTRTVIVRLDRWPQLFALPSELREESPQAPRGTSAASHPMQ